jgi:hypothetical protein
MVCRLKYCLYKIKGIQQMCPPRKDVYDGMVWNLNLNARHIGKIPIGNRWEWAECQKNGHLAKKKERCWIGISGH